MAVVPPIDKFKDLKDINTSFLSSTGIINLGYNLNTNKVEILDYLHKDLGFVFLQDSQYTSLNPFPVSASITTTIPINASGSFTNYTNVPIYAYSWWNTSNNKFYPNSSGEYFIGRLNFTVLLTLNNKSIVITTDIGTSNKITSDTIFLNSGAGIGLKITSLMCFGTNNTYKNNGMKIEITSECDCYIYNISLLLHRC